MTTPRTMSLPVHPKGRAGTSETGWTAGTASAAFRRSWSIDGIIMRGDGYSRLQPRSGFRKGFGLCCRFSGNRDWFAAGPDVRPRPGTTGQLFRGFLLFGLFDHSSRKTDEYPGKNKNQKRAEFIHSASPFPRSSAYYFFVRGAGSDCCGVLALAMDSRISVSAMVFFIW